MWELLIEYEAPLRLGLFACAFVALAAWEIMAPRRALSTSKKTRWPANLGILIMNTVMIRAVAPAAAVGIAVFAQERGIGLLHAFEWPLVLEIMLAVLALDLAIYLQHVMFHAVPLLWRLHRVHHADADIDVTTGARFHPIEILLSMLVKFAAIAVLGAPAAAVLVFEVLLNATAMFNHANLRLREPVDRWLRRILVTPEMHRIHHSMEVAETNSNFGFNLPWWDRLCGTYRERARLPQESMAIGVQGLTGSEAAVKLTGLLSLPFARSVGGYAIGGAAESGHEAS
jgi:sterol desaturase/sphingolipid hydroxylase (fatty acid hydroxylase superfamily)